MRRSGSDSVSTNDLAQERFFQLPIVRTNMPLTFYTFFQKQRAAVCGLLSFFGYQVYQIGAAVAMGRVDSPYMQSTYRQQVEEKVKEEYDTKDNIIDKRDWYQKEDDSYQVSLIESRNVIAYANLPECVASFASLCTLC
jgi:hypothetical protein